MQYQQRERSTAGVINYSASTFGSWFSFWPIWKCWQGIPEHLLLFRQKSKGKKEIAVGYFMFATLQLIWWNLVDFNSNLLSSSLFTRRSNSVWGAWDKIVLLNSVWGRGICHWSSSGCALEPASVPSVSSPLSPAFCCWSRLIISLHLFPVASSSQTQRSCQKMRIFL